MVTLATLLDKRTRQEFGPTFGGLEPEFCEFSSSSIAILPVPYDRTSTYAKGSDHGPRAILEASTQVELYDIETQSEVYKKGISTLAPLIVEDSPEVLCHEVTTAVRLMLEEKRFPVVIGGEHSISPGIVGAVNEVVSDLSVLQLDAHGDTRESYHGSRYNHACAMARVREICPIVQVGIRAIDVSEAAGLDMSRVFFSHQIQEPDRSWQERVCNKLSKNVYVTIDLDCFDCSVMPSTGTPEPGGLSWYQVTSLLRLIAMKRTVVGFDVVELLPRKENPAPDFLAAKLVYQFLSYIFSEKRGSK